MPVYRLPERGVGQAPTCQEAVAGCLVPVRQLRRWDAVPSRRQALPSGDHHPGDGLPTRQRVEEIAFEPGAELGVCEMSDALVGVHEQNPFAAGQRRQGVEQRLGELLASPPVVLGLFLTRLSDGWLEIDVDGLRGAFDPASQRCALLLVNLRRRRLDLRALTVQLVCGAPVGGEVDRRNLPGQLLAERVEPPVPLCQAEVVEIEQDAHPLGVMEDVQVVQQAALAVAAEPGDAQDRGGAGGPQRAVGVQDRLRLDEMLQLLEQAPVHCAPPGRRASRSVGVVTVDSVCSCC